MFKTKLFTLNILFFVPFIFFGQTINVSKEIDSTKKSITEKFVFCDMISTKNIFGNKEEFKFDYGKVNEIFIDSLDLIKPSILQKQKKLVDVLNIMGSNGWEVIHTYSTSKNSYIQQHYVFQKKIIINKK